MRTVNSARRAAVARVVATAVVLTAVAAGQAGAAPAWGPRISRAELEAIQASVEAAVARVSRPAGLMFGRPSRAYHLKGYGAVVVLAPRALPRIRRQAAEGPQARAFADVLVGLERSLEDVRDPAARRRLEETLVALRNGLPPGQPLLLKRAPRPRLATPPRDIQSLQEEAEAFRREAERAMEKAEREVLVRLRLPENALPALAPAPPPLPPASAPPPPALGRVPPMPSEPHVEVLGPPAAPAPPAPPGWPFWFGEEEGEDAPPERILSDVRRAIVSGLGAYRGELARLGPDEFVVVAVDFVQGTADRAGSRTVVARARKRDLAEHRAGRISADALRARVEFDEY